MTPEPDLHPELLAWAEAAGRRITADYELPGSFMSAAERQQLIRQCRDLRHEVYNTSTSDFDGWKQRMSEWSEMQQQQKALDPTTALGNLIEAAENPPREAVIALAIATTGPWCGTRAVKDRPDRGTQPIGELIRFLSRYGDFCASEPLPRETGLLAYARFHELAVPVADVRRRGPSWLQTADFDGGWLALPPKGGRPELDARLLFLHSVCLAVPEAQRDDPGVRLAVETLAEWFSGRRYAAWPVDEGLGWVHVLDFPWRQSRARWEGEQRVADDELVAVLADRCLHAGVVSETWTPPPSDPAVVAAQQERERIIAEGKAATEAWLNRPGRRRAAEV